MAIAIGHSQDPSAAPRLAYGAGKQQGIAAKQSEERQYAFREQESARKRQQQLDAMQMNSMLQQEAAQQSQQRKMEMMDQSWQMKDDHEKQQVQDKRVQYLRKRELIDEEKRNGRINEQQYEYAMSELQGSYSDGDVDVTDPFFADLAKKDQELTMEMPDGTMSLIAIDLQSGQLDKYKTQQDWKKANDAKQETIMKMKQDWKKANDAKQETIMKMKMEIMKAKTKMFEDYLAKSMVDPTSTKADMYEERLGVMFKPYEDMIARMGAPQQAPGDEDVERDQTVDVDTVNRMAEGAMRDRNPQTLAALMKLADSGNEAAISAIQEMAKIEASAAIGAN